MTSDSDATPARVAGWMRLVRRGWLRGAYRAVATLVLCSLAAFQLEALIADVCDGDATAVELAAFGRPAPEAPDEPGAVPPASHAHVCHCVHAHGGVLPRVETVGVVTVASASAMPVVRHLAPPSVTPEPLLRPPLA